MTLTATPTISDVQLAEPVPTHVARRCVSQKFDPPVGSTILRFEVTKGEPFDSDEQPCYAKRIEQIEGVRLWTVCFLGGGNVCDVHVRATDLPLEHFASLVQNALSAPA